MTRNLQSFPVACSGGLNLEADYLSIPPGHLIGAKNIEQKQRGGYKRADGYEKWDAAAPSGSGAIVAVGVYDDTVYAWRSDGSKYLLYRSTGAGWTSVPLGVLLYFDGGANEPAEGDTIYAGATTGVVSRLIVTSGAWGTADAAGFISLRDTSGDWTAVADNTNLTSSGGATTYCVLNGSAVNVEVTGQPKSGAFHNFYGGTDDGAFYWCDGSDYVIEVRPSVNYVAVLEQVCDFVMPHAEHLFFGIASSGRMQSSVPGSPFLIDGSLSPGSVDIATGAPMSGMRSFRGVLYVGGDSQSGLLYGSNANDFVFKRLDGVGAMSGIDDGIATEVEGKMLFLSQQGWLYDLASTDAFGDFSSAAVTQQINRDMKAKRANIVGIGRRADKGQVRVFYSDKTAYYFTFFGGQFVGVTPVTLGVQMASYATSADSSVSTAEIAVFGGSDGYVYKMDTGKQYDGSAVESFMVFPYWHCGSPTARKRWRTLFVEGEAAGAGALLRVKQAYDLSTAMSGVAIDDTLLQETAVGGTPGIWGSSVWGSFTWGGDYSSEDGFELSGTSRNMSITVYNDGTDADDGDYEIDAFILNYTVRAAARE